MRYERVYLDALGYALAPVVVTSDDLEAELEPVYRALHLPEGQLEALTGVRERRWWEPGTRLSDGAARAAQDALEKSQVAPTDLDVVIYTGVCREYFEPATACRVAHLIGAKPTAGVFDLSNACLGVLNGILEIANRIELGQARAGLVVSCESAREINEITIQRLVADPTMPHFTHALATFTGGSGAAAVIVTDGSFGSRRRRFAGGVHLNAPEHHDLCRWGLERGPLHADRPLDEHREFMATDSVAVLEHGVELGVRTFDAFLSEVTWTTDHIDRTICHQVGSVHQKTILERLGLDPSRDFVTFPYLGNIGTVSLPLTAAIAEQRGHLEVGQHVGFLGIGSGLNCLMQGYEW